MKKVRDHMCDYEVKDEKDHPFFTHVLVCKECGKVGNRFSAYS